MFFSFCWTNFHDCGYVAPNSIFVSISESKGFVGIFCWGIESRSGARPTKGWLGRGSENNEASGKLEMTKVSP
jgi:hypothetical protein